MCVSVKLKLKTNLYSAIKSGDSEALCVCLSVRTIIFELNNLSARTVASAVQGGGC